MSARDAGETPGAGPALRTVIPALAASQLIGWGTTLYLPGVLGRAIEAELGLPGEIVFGGISLMLVGGALAGPAVGRALDRHGARPVMTAGSFLLTAGLVLLGFAQGVASYVAAWALIGLSTPMCLSTGAYTALAQLVGQDARRAITVLTFFTGLTSTIFWPLTAALEPFLGWRAVCLLYAAANLSLALPIHWLALPSRTAAPPPPPPDARREKPLPASLHTRAFALLVMAFTCQSFVSWGVQIHVINIFTGLGVAGPVAVMAAALKGPCQVSARVMEFVSAGRHPATLTGLIGMGALVASLVLLLGLGGSTASALAFAVVYGVSDGLMTLAKPAIPLSLFGERGYGGIVGRLSRPQNLVAALAPILFASGLARVGVETTLWLSLVIAALGLGAAVAAHRLRAKSVSELRAAAATPAR